MAWPEKLPSGRYRGGYRDARGKKQWVPGTFSHKAKATRAASVAEEEARQKAWLDPEAFKRPWGTWCDEWWPTRSVEPSTLGRDASRRTSHLDPAWADVPIGAITRHEVKAWAMRLRAGGLGPSSVQRCVHLLSASLAAAVDAEVLEYNPAARIKLPKGALADERYLQPGEYDAIREQLPDTDSQLVADFLVGTGVRWGEMAGLHRHRLNLVGGTVEIVETYDERAGTVKPYPKGRRARGVPLRDDLVAALRIHLEDTPDPGSCGCDHVSGRCRSGLVFTTASGVPLRNSNWSIRWRKAVTASGVGHARIYDLRHTFASWMLQNGASLEEVGQVLGHLSTETTKIYAHLARKHSASVREAINAPRLPHEGTA
ncbi:MAG: site-specific integrase [Nocardioides sp.]|uniref:tyrosine-type recombinase/integrase n=1 Tax=Nocardioides sp. TaxID=35761 RepID=UPI0032668D26